MEKNYWVVSDPQKTILVISIYRLRWVRFQLLRMLLHIVPLLWQKTNLVAHNEVTALICNFNPETFYDNSIDEYVQH